MKKLLNVLAALLMVAGFTLSAQKGFSYAFNPWTTMTGDKVFVINPFVKAVNFDAKFNAIDPVLLYGFSPTMDIIVNPGSFTMTDGTTDYATSWILPRYDLGSNNILGLQIGYDKTGYMVLAESLFITPQYNFVFENDSFAFELNLGIAMPFEDMGSSIGYAILAPVYKILPGQLHVYLELDPFFPMAEGVEFNMNMLPGIWMGFSEGKYQVSLAAFINNVTEANGGAMSYGVGLWAWFAF
jgi:hypothetical protein